MIHLFQNLIDGLKDSIQLLNTIVRRANSDLHRIEQLSKFVSNQILPGLPKANIHHLIYASNVPWINLSFLHTSDGKNYLVDQYHLINTLGLRFLNNKQIDSTLVDPKIEVFAFSNIQSIKKANNSIELPGSHLEAKNIKKTYPRSNVYSGYDATKSTFKEVYKSMSTKHLFLYMN